MQVPLNPASAEHSDEEDLYAFDTDDLPHSSDSELVSHPSDNEDHPDHQDEDHSPSFSPLHSPSFSPSLSPALTATLFLNDDPFPASYSPQHPSTRSSKDQDHDDFFLVEPADLDSLSRPHSSLSHHSDHEREPMHLIYPSMMLSSPKASTPVVHRGHQESMSEVPSPPKETSRPPLAHQTQTTEDDQEVPTVEIEDTHSQMGMKKEEQGEKEEEEKEEQAIAHIEERKRSTIEGSDLEVNEEELPLPRHAPRTVQLVPEVAIPDQELQIDHQKVPSPTLVSQPFVLGQSQKGKLLGESALFEFDDVPATTALPTKPFKDSALTAAIKNSPTPQSVKQPLRPQAATEIRSKAPSWMGRVVRLGIVSASIAVALVAVLYVATTFDRTRGSNPAHVTIRKVDYALDSRLSMVYLDLHTVNHAPFKSRKPFPLHTRVLEEGTPCSIEEAPAHALVADPIIQDLHNGSFVLYISSYRNQKSELTRPDASQDDALHLHLWFANGTHVPQTPHRLFEMGTDTPTKEKTATTKIEDAFRGLPKVAHKAYDSLFAGSKYVAGENDASSEEEEADLNNLKSWADRMQQVTDSLSNRLSNMSMPWLSEHWDRMQPSLYQLQSFSQMALAYAQESARKVARLVQAWRDQALGEAESVLDQSETILQRAKSNARRLTSQASERMHCRANKLYDQVESNPDVQELRASLEEQLNTVRESVLKTVEKIPTEKILLKVDKVLHEAESRVETLLKSETVRKAARHVNADTVKKKADKILSDTERRLEAILQSELSLQVGEKLQAMVNEFKAKPSSHRLVRHAKVAQKKARKQWRDLQKRIAAFAH